MSLPPSEDSIKLTRYARGAGCGCKIAPDILDIILKDGAAAPPHPGLLVGYGSRDDAAVLDMGNGRALISTTDFFTPIVNDAYDLGRVASINAINDVYAMGGRPVMAVGILGWPVEKLPATLAARVLEGARAACAVAGIPLAGGHSIDAPEPFFGLAVTGEVDVRNIKRNNTAQVGDLLLLTKPIGIGVLATALKREKLSAQQEQGFVDLLCGSLEVGAALGGLEGVHAMTDVTGFGLLGHLLEMCDGSGVGAHLYMKEVPLLPDALDLLRAGCYPDGTFRNIRKHGARVYGAGEMEVMMMLNDPQTSGGLLIAIAADTLADARKALTAHEIPTIVIGKITEAGESASTIRLVPTPAE